MIRDFLLFLSAVVLPASLAFAGPNITAPKNGATVPKVVHFSATAGSTSCSNGVASMGVYSSPGVLAYVSNGTTLDTDLTYSTGTYDSTVEQWDNCGGASTTHVSITVTEKSGVYVTSPSSGSTVGSSVHFAATATSTCSKGVAAMGIYTAPYQKAYVVSGDSLDTSLTLSPGKYNTTIEEWDKCGGAATAASSITVTGGKTFSEVQANKGWIGYGELPPKYAICTSCGSGVTWSLGHGVTSPALSGNAAKFSIGGKTPYADVLWVNHLIGDGSTEGLPDSSHTLIPTLHNFTYDVYFYGTNLSLSENIELDLGQFFNNQAYLFGLQCQIVNGQVWGVWNNVSNKWVRTSVPCKPKSNSWNHVVLDFERTSGDQLLYKSVTLNGVTTNLNIEYPPISAPGWWGVVVNFQLDGNYKQSPYSVYVDKMNIGYN
ncbi:MAG TPA: hypothetical protein VMG31_14820 [Verrucomicrobiae bacterium]|nr:hypothetical protein [Verrucomicrobiae bacterium]